MRTSALWLSALLVACGGKTNDGNGTADATSDVALDTHLDEPPPDTDVGPSVDTPGSISYAIEATVTEDCMPIVADDPIAIVGTITIDNEEPMAIGPIMIRSGSVVDTTGKVLTTFVVEPVVSLPSIPYRSTATGKFSKKAGSASPANKCSTLPCGGKVHVVLVVEGPGIAPYRSSAASPLLGLTCGA